MNYRTVLTVAAILSILYGVGFMLLPGPLASIYDVDLTDSGRYVAQMYGSALFGFGLVNWFARDFDGGKVRRALLTANTVAAALGFVFSLIAQLGGVPGANALGWSTVGLYLLLALWLGYVRLMRA